MAQFSGAAPGLQICGYRGTRDAVAGVPEGPDLGLKLLGFRALGFRVSGLKFHDLCLGLNCLIGVKV